MVCTHQFFFFALVMHWIREILNNSLGCMGELVRDTEGATHALSCGVPDRDSNETEYLKEALERMNDWQDRCSRRPSGSHDGPDTTEVVLCRETAVVYCGRVSSQRATSLNSPGMRSTVVTREP